MWVSGPPSRSGKLKLYGRVALQKKKAPVKAKFEYIPTAIIGRGAFGVVYASRGPDGKRVAVKKVLLDPTYRNRELEIFRAINHPNCVKMLHNFKLLGKKPNEVYLNIVMEYVPLSLDEFISRYRQDNLYTPPLYVKLFAFQLFAGLEYIHSLRIVHRDIKPTNILVNPETGELKICDFGSAKRIEKNERSVSYIASRYYRAPELTMGCTQYTSAIDVWAAGCVVAEMINGGFPLFQGKSPSDQIRAIARSIGEPTESDMSSFRHEDDDFFLGFSNFGTEPFINKLPSHTPPELIDIFNNIFIYNPKQRLTAFQVMQHPYFDELFITKIKMPSNRPFPNLVRKPPKRMVSSSDGLRYL